MTSVVVPEHQSKSEPATLSRSGNVAAMECIASAPRHIDALLVKGSSLSRLGGDDAFPTESDIEAQLANTFRETRGLALVHTSAQNVDRLVSIFRAARKTGRTLVIDLYAAAVLEATGNSNLPQSDWKDVALESHSIPRVSIHTSGHASPKDLKTFVEALAPKRVVPIHSFKPELYPQLFDNVEPHADGEWWNV